MSDDPEFDALFAAASRVQPLARSTKNGSPPTLRKARTGEFTPPGMSSFAAAKSLDEMLVDMRGR